MAECVPNTDFRLPCLTMVAGETFPATLSFFGLCAQFYEINERYELGDFVWPTSPMGFVLECTRAGWSAGKEPRWKQYGVDQTVEDGSAQFTLRVPNLINGLQPITDASAVPASGLTVSGAVVSESTKVLVDYLAPDPGEFECVWTVMIAGRPRIARQQVHVLEK